MLPPYQMCVDATGIYAPVGFIHVTTNVESISTALQRLANPSVAASGGQGIFSFHRDWQPWYPSPPPSLQDRRALHAC
jgi:hypothetical protein